MNRRELIRRTFTAVAATSVAMAIRARELVGEGKSPSRVSKKIPPITAAVYDERYGDARAFALALNALGVIAFPTRQDIGQLWYGKLREHLVAHEGRVVGFTPYSDLYVIQAMVRDMRLRVLYEGCHDCRGRDEMMHYLRKGYRPCLAAALKSAEPLWPVVLAQNLTTFAPGPGSDAQHAVSTMIKRAHDNPGVMVSWLIGSE